MERSKIKKLCPKCRGKLYLDKDHYGWYEHCLQCGLSRDFRLVYKDEEGPLFAELEKLEGYKE